MKKNVILYLGKIMLLHQDVVFLYIRRRYMTNKTIKTITAAFLMLLAAGASTVTAKAASVHLTLVEDWDASRQMFDYINEYREANGINPLLWNDSVSECAMQRAAETFVCATHDRPNGKSFGGWECFSCVDEDVVTCVDGWKKDEHDMGLKVHSDAYGGCAVCYIIGPNNERVSSISMIFDNYQVSELKTLAMDFNNIQPTSSQHGKVIATREIDLGNTDVSLAVLAQDTDYASVKGSDGYWQSTQTTFNVPLQDYHYGSNIHVNFTGCPVNGIGFSASATNLVTHKTSNPSVGEWTSDGVFVVHRPGEVTVTLGLKKDPQFTATRLLRFKDTFYTDKSHGRRSNRSTFALDKTRYTYTGKECKPKATVTWKNNFDQKETLEEGVDYEVIYKDNIEPGTATATIKGLGCIDGEQVLTFTIAPKEEQGENPGGGSSSGGNGGNDNPGTNGNNNNSSYNDASPSDFASNSLKAAVSSMGENSDFNGTTISQMLLKASKVKNNCIKLTWKNTGAYGYLVYGAKCGFRYSKIASVGGLSYTVPRLKKGTYYKFFVASYNYAGKITAISKCIHVATSGGKYGNTKKISVKKKKVTLKRGKSFKLKAKVVKPSGKKIKTHRKLIYESSNTRVATVSKSGKIKAVSKGSCVIYVYAQDGKCQKVKVKVK